MKKISAAAFIVVLLAMLTGCAPAIYTAAATGNIREVKALLDQGVEVNEKNGNILFHDYSPLRAASISGHYDIVKLLLDKGANIDTAEMGDVPPLSFAAARGHTDVVKLLIERGADINKAILGLSRVKGDGGNKESIELLKEYKKEKAARQNILSNTSAESPSPAIKSDVDELPAIKAQRNKNAYAIVIGIEHYRQKLPKADFASADAKIFTEYLTKVMGYPEENVITLINEHATYTDLVKYFEKWLHNNVEAGSSVFIYFSGHGSPNPKTGDAYLVPYDGDPSFIAESGYSLKRMYETLGKLHAKEIVVALDSCFSGAGGRSVIAKGARPLVMNLQSNVVLSKNMTVLSASSGEQISSTYDEKGHGLFTYFMLKGIKNEDVIKPDGSIRMDDLFGYIKPQVERIARKQYNNQQTPQLMGTKKD